jgi:hypothetical protein
MDIVILSTIILAGIALESLVSERARRRTEHEDAIDDGPTRWADRKLE